MSTITPDQLLALLPEADAEPTPWTDLVALLPEGTSDLDVFAALNALAEQGRARQVVGQGWVRLAPAPDVETSPEEPAEPVEKLNGIGSGDLYFEDADGNVVMEVSALRSASGIRLVVTCAYNLTVVAGDGAEAVFEEVAQ